MNLKGIRNSDISYWIDEYVHSERDRLILKKRLIDGYTYQQIIDYLYLEHIELSERQVKNIVYRAQRELFDGWNLQAGE